MTAHGEQTAGGMKGGVRRPRGPSGSWSFVLYLGVQPAQRCRNCNRRFWVGAERLVACPECGGGLRETSEPRQATEGGYATRHDCEFARAAALARLGKGHYVPSERMTLAAFLRDHWLPTVAASSRLKQTTKESYARHVHFHLIGPGQRPHALGMIELRRLTLGAIRQHYRDLSQGYVTWDCLRSPKTRRQLIDETTGRPRMGLVPRPGLSASTLRRVHACLHSALAYAVEAGHLDHNPAWRAARELGDDDVGQWQPNAWTNDELWTFLDSQEGHQLYGLWRLAALTGMRRGELLALRWADVDSASRRITVRRSRVPVEGGVVIETSTKTNKVRVVDLDEETIETLRALRRSRPVVAIDDRNAYVFTDAAGEPLSPYRVSYLFRIAVQRAGLRTITFHGLRHTHATALLDAKVPLHVVSRRLGHANPTITLNVYSHVMPGAQAEAVAAVQRPSPKSS